MSDNKETTFDDKCNILAELWIDYRDEEDLQEFISYSDLGLPLAFAIVENLVTPTPRAKELIVESFALLLGSLEIEDTGFTNVEELMLG
jgi:hypothetical protein